MEGAPWPTGLPRAVDPLLRRLAAAAAAGGEALYLVGGTVRDLLLRRPLRDVDLLVEGDAAALARRAAQGHALRVTCHPRFGTARLQDPATGTAVDLASPRAESYPRPGALPRVRPASVAQDLARRDFTINAMALPLAGSPGTGGPLDPHGGREDLRRRLVRVLHPDSFRDDPTRALRAVRLSVRLGFRLERTTSAWLGEAVRDGGVGRLSPARLAGELERVAREERLAALLARLARRGLLAALHPALVPPRRPGAGRRLERLLPEAPAAERLLALVAYLALDATAPQVDAILQRLQLPAGGRRWLPAIVKRARALARPGRQPLGTAPALASPPAERAALRVAEAWCTDPGRRRELARRRQATV